MEIEKAGSVWNKNAWHWEEKNYTKWSLEEIKKIFNDFQINVDNYDSFKLTINDIQGDSSVSIRKGKRILCFDFKLKFEYQAKKEDIYHCGFVEIPELTADNFNERDYEIRVTQKCDSPGQKALKGYLDSNFKKHFDEKFLNYVENFKNHDLQNLQKEKKFNLENLVERDEKDEKPKDLKENAKMNALSAEPSTVPVQISSSNDKAQGSVWNANSYHWEERELGDWTRQNLSKELKSQKIYFLDDTAEMKFFAVEVTGESSMSIRKGKQILFFDLKINADWICVCRSKDGAFMADSKGQMLIPEFSSENSSESQINFVFDSKHPASERINNAIRAEGSQKILSVLEKFVEKIKQKQH